MMVMVVMTEQLHDNDGRGFCSGNVDPGEWYYGGCFRSMCIDVNNR